MSRRVPLRQKIDLGHQLLLSEWEMLRAWAGH